MKQKEEKKKRSGIVLRSFAVLPFLAGSIGLTVAIILNLVVWDSPDNVDFVVQILVPILAACLLVTVLLILCDIKAKKYVWCNNVFLVLSSLICLGAVAGFFICFWMLSSDILTTIMVYSFIVVGLVLFGVLPLIGSIRGRRWTLPLRQQRREERILEKARIAEERAQREEASQAAVGADGTIEAQAADPTILRKRSILSWVFFGVVVAYYLFLLIIGILGIALPEKGILWSIEDPISGPIENYLSGFVCLLFLPSFCYYLAFRGPFRFRKLVSWILAGSGLFVTIIGIILYLCLLSDYFLFTDEMMKFVPLLSNLGLIAVYGMGFLRIDPKKIRKVDYADDELPDDLKTLFIKLVHGIANGGRALLRWRNSAPFVAIGTILFTLCVFELIEMLYALLALIFCLLVLGIALFLSYRPVHPDYRLLTPYERILKYREYDVARGTDVYEDDLGDRWETSDGGRTFSRVAPFSSGIDEKIEGNKMDE